MALDARTPDKFIASVKALVGIHGTRGAARFVGMSHATISRIANDKPLDLKTAQMLYDKIGVCACCGHVRGRTKP